MKRSLFVCWFFFGIVVVPFSYWAAAPLEAQVVTIDEDFEEDNPCEPGSGWNCVGSGANPTWFSSDDVTCLVDPLDPFCNLFDPPEGYVRLTSDIGNDLGLMWRDEKILWDNFRLTAEVELEGGSSPPADGMTIVIIGSDSVPNTVGNGGGGMAATGHGAFPTMIFEFDNWSNGAPDRDNNNHVGFEYSATGFPATDQVPSDAFAIVPIPLNGSGKFFFEVLVQNGTVACNLTNEDAGLPETRMYTYQIPVFEPFEGYLGMTASTGGSFQNHILHSIRVETLPDDFCLQPPAAISRDLRADLPPEEDDCGDVTDDEEVLVTLTIDSLREVDDSCDEPEGIIITETPPAGWEVEDISDGGEFKDSGGGVMVVEWTIDGGDLVEGKELSYTVIAVVDPFGLPVSWSGTFAEDVAFAEPFSIVGELSIAPCRVGEVLGIGTAALLGGDLTDLDNDGNETLYFPPADLGGFDAIFFSSDEPGFGGGEFAFNVFDNIVGPGNDKWCCGTVFPQIVGADFSETLGEEFLLTHFTVTSANDTPGRDPRVWRIEGSNDDGETWVTIFSQNDPDATLWTARNQVILFQEGIEYEEQEEGYSMFRMVTEATGLTAGAFFQIGEIEFFGEESGGEPRERICDDGIDNDDDGDTDCADSDCETKPVCIEEICDNGIDDDSDGDVDCADAECSDEPVCIDEICDNDIDDDNDGDIDCDDAECTDQPVCQPQGIPFIRGDANSDGAANISDASYILNWLFLGGPDLPCLLAGDANTDGTTNISDASFILNFLFLGGPDISTPNACGEEPLADEADCLASPACE